MSIEVASARPVGGNGRLVDGGGGGGPGRAPSPSISAVELVDGPEPSSMVMMKSPT
jgi:hypothetical protein